MTIFFFSRAVTPSIPGGKLQIQFRAYDIIQTTVKKFVFGKSRFSKKLQVLKKKWCAKFWITTNTPPPHLNWPLKILIFPKLLKKTQKLFLEVFSAKIPFSRSKKLKIVIWVVEITQNRLGFIFQRIEFFHVFKVFSPLNGPKNVFFQNSQNFNKLRF